MDFAEQVKELIAVLDENKGQISNEGETRHSLVMPFLQTLGYNVFNPNEVKPEFIADVGTRKNEKVDYAIVFDKTPKVLIEVKAVRSNLQAGTKEYNESWNQLFRYFTVTKAKFAILTNGIQYQFFSALDDGEKMDQLPFFAVDLVSPIKDSAIDVIQKFHKNVFPKNEEELLSLARNLKYTDKIKSSLKKQLKEPEDEFVKFFINPFFKDAENKKNLGKKQIEKFRPIVVNAFRQYVNELVSDPRPIEVGEKLTLQKKWDFDSNVIKIIDKKDKDKDKLHLRFWTQLLEYAKTKTNLHSKISPSKESSISMGSGVAGLTYCYSITKHHGTVELYIFRGKDSGTENKEIFEKLSMAKKEIEQSFGEQLEWEPLENKQACRIKKTISYGGYLDEQEWPKIQETMVGSMIGLEKALNPQIIKIMK
jgi:hypothetical protein